MRERRSTIIIKPIQKNNPLESAGFLSLWFFTWLKELLTLANKVPFEQEMHYDLPKYDLVETHKARILNGLKKKKTILGMIFYTYRRNIIEYTIVGVISSIISFSTSFYLANIIQTVTKAKDFKDPAVTYALIKNFSLLGLSNIFNQFLGA